MNIHETHRGCTNSFNDWCIHPNGNSFLYCWHEPIIFDPPIQADETKGLEDIQLKNFMDSRLKRISWPQYIVIMFGYPDVQKQFLLKYTLLFPIMFLTSCACCFLYLRKKSANKGIQADAAEPRG